MKEWSLNAQGDHHYILGGAWDEPQYMILRAESFPPLFRRNNFGFRCMQTLSENDIYQAAAAPVEMVQPPDYSQYEPCTDGEFQLLKSFYDYPPTELDAVVVSRQERAQEIVTEEVSFSAAYGGERMIAYLFLPKNGKPPFQVMIYYPGGAANYLRSIYEYNIEDQVDWIVKSNRAVVVPVYKGTFQRPYEPVEKTSYAVWRERDEKGIKDLKRTIDYLETRPDLDTDKIGFYGISTGAAS